MQSLAKQIETIRTTLDKPQSDDDYYFVAGFDYLANRLVHNPMKSPITLNVGLTDNLGSPVNVHTACLALESYGFNLLASRVFDSSYEGKKEPVLVISAVYRGGNLTASLLALAVNLRQDCIAIYANEVGSLCPSIYDFDPALFLTISGKTLSEKVTVKFSNDGETWHNLTWPFKISPIVFENKKAAQDEIARCTYESSRSNQEHRIYKIIPA